MPPQRIQFGAFELDSAAGELRKHGIKIKLQEQPLQILQQLLLHPGEVVTREELQKRIWPADTFVDFDHGLYSAVQRLRDALGDTAETPRYVETLPRRGYRFIAPVINGNGVEVNVGTGSVAAPASSVPERPASRRSLRMPVLAAAGVILVALLFALAFRSGNFGERLLGKAAVPLIRSLAVLPLQNLSSDPNQEYFADGMTDALITDLAQIGSLKVISRTTTIRYKKSDKTLPEIARELNVDGIVEGTVQRSGDRVRITAQLIYGPKDEHLWADSYERDMQDAFALQGVVARAIADEIRVKLTPQEQERLRNVRPVNLKALEAYLSGRFHLDRSGQLTYYRGKGEEQSKELRKAVSYLDRAVQEDPSYIPAYVAYFDVVDAESISPLEYLPKAQAALRKALELDESNVSAHLGRARLLQQFEYDWPGAEKEIKQALELRPNSAEAHYQYAQYFLCTGRQEEEMKENNLAQALDPARDYFADAGIMRVGWTLEQQKQALEERAPNDPFSRALLGKNYAIAGRFDESAEEWERSMRLYGYTEFADTIRASQASAGGKAALRDWMHAAEEAYPREVQLPTPGFAFTYASLGDKNNAFRWLEKAYQERNWCILYLKNDSVWDPIRSDPRFANLLRRVGLPP